MKLRDIFHKPVDRPIEGVIKADDEASLLQEVEEYVLTNEVEQRLEEFLDAYNNYQGANGVWISGFFGSGKSHLLKMLALLMENREIEGSRTLDLFLPKCTENKFLKAGLEKAVSIPSQSILFNIDQKADVISKTQIDALLAVFVKVFNEARGYYGKHGYIAQFEKDLDDRGLYDKFKEAFSEVAGTPWERGREQPFFEKKNIAAAYATVTGNSAEHSMDILDHYSRQYKVSIEDFAEQVRDYVEKKGPGFRLNFFVDEVGQYIAENVKLMTNLQTIAESLATKCRGRAWIVVTSQNDMSSMLGEFNAQHGHDFSKIMARFKTRMLLTGTNVAEVVQRRLLAKNEPGADLVSELYDEQSNNLGTLFSFTQDSRAYRPYRDREEFVSCYPFVPYQFELFQSSIENLSRHNAFEGKHTSVGERSMLGVFRQVAIQISDYDIGQLASFDLMFEGIQSALKAQTQSSILAAGRQLDDQFAVKLLKALFLVKYVREFKATVHNLCVLMLSSFDEDYQKLQKSVQKALNILEQQSYIQRNADVYEFLTDTEKDVIIEIKNTEVERSDLMSELEKITFDHILKSRKIRYASNNQDYPFSRKMDDRLRGREYELSIHIITPFNEQSENIPILKAQTTGKNELMVIMPSDDRFVRDMLMYKRTEKYIRQNTSTVQQEKKRAQDNEAINNNERYRELLHRAKQILGRSMLIVSGKELEIRGEDPQARISRGFHDLIARVYPNLRMLRNLDYKEEHVKKILTDKTNTLEGTGAVPLSEAEQEVMSFIHINNRNGVRTTLKFIMEHFASRPYGWYYAAIICMLASLIAKGKVEAKVDSTPLEGDELERSLRNSHAHGNIIVEPQIEPPTEAVRMLKDFYNDFFDVRPGKSEPRSLAKETGEKLTEMKSQLDTLYGQAALYPFLADLKPIIEKLDKAKGQPYTWYLSDFLNEIDDLLDLKEDIIDPVLGFMNGPQKSIYDEVREFIHDQQPNFDYIQGNETLELNNILSSGQCFKGNKINKAKGLMEKLKGMIDAQVDSEIDRAVKQVAQFKDNITVTDEYKILPDDQKALIIQAFDDFSANIRSQKIIAVISDSLRRFEEIKYPELLNLLTPPGKGYGNSGGKTGASDRKDKVEEPKIKSLRSIPVRFEKPWLANDADVEQYISFMREALLEQIKKGRKIQI